MIRGHVLRAACRWILRRIHAIACAVVAWSEYYLSLVADNDVVSPDQQQQPYLRQAGEPPQHWLDTIQAASQPPQHWLDDIQARIGHIPRMQTYSVSPDDVQQQPLRRASAPPVSRSRPLVQSDADARLSDDFSSEAEQEPAAEQPHSRIPPHVRWRIQPQPRQTARPFAEQYPSASRLDDDEHVHTEQTRISRLNRRMGYTQDTNAANDNLRANNPPEPHAPFENSTIDTAPASPAKSPAEQIPYQSPDAQAGSRGAVTYQRMTQHPPAHSPASAAPIEPVEPVEPAAHRASRRRSIPDRTPAMLAPVDSAQALSSEPTGAHDRDTAGYVSPPMKARKPLSYPPPATQPLSPPVQDATPPDSGSRLADAGAYQSPGRPARPVALRFTAPSAARSASSAEAAAGQSRINHDNAQALSSRRNDDQPSDYPAVTTSSTTAPAAQDAQQAVIAATPDFWVPLPDERNERKLEQQGKPTPSVRPSRREQRLDDEQRGAL